MRRHARWSVYSQERERPTGVRSMSWYDFISPIYDLGATGSGRPRRAAIEQLRAEPGDVVLDLACGTGLNFPQIEGAIGPTGLLIGLDYSRGMLARAQTKVVREGWQNTRLIHADARALSRTLLVERVGVDQVDRVLCTLGLSVIPDWEQALANSWALLKPGGRCSIMDWHVTQRNLFAWFLNSISQGDVSRATWTLLRDHAEDYARRTFIGGNVFVAAGKKPGEPSKRP